MNQEEQNHHIEELRSVHQALASDPTNAALRKRARTLRRQLVGKPPSGILLTWDPGGVVGVSIAIRRDTEQALAWLAEAWKGPLFSGLDRVEIGRCSDLSAVLAALSGLPRQVSALHITTWRPHRQEAPQSIPDLTAIQDHPGLTTLTIQAESVTLSPLRLPALEQVQLHVIHGSREAVQELLPETVALTFRQGDGESPDETEDPYDP